MSTPKKLLGFKLGKHEKSILQLMRKGNDPPGKPIPIWADICQTHGIDFSAYPKKFQQAELCKENKYKCALTRLIKARLIKPAIMVKDGFSVPDPKGNGYNYYSLTELGYLVVEKLQQPNPKLLLFLKETAELEKALDQLKALGTVEVTADQVREIMWQLSGNSFSSRIVFDMYWNNTKLGRLLRNCTVGQVRIGGGNRHRKYFLV